jgi:hypothetical protein
MWGAAAIRELKDEDIAQWAVVRVNDDIALDLMTEAFGVTFEDAQRGIEFETFEGVPIPFAGAEPMLKTKRGSRGKGAGDRSFLQQPIRNRPAGPWGIKASKPCEIGGGAGI